VQLLLGRSPSLLLRQIQARGELVLLDDQVGGFSFLFRAMTESSPSESPFGNNISGYLRTSLHV